MKAKKQISVFFVLVFVSIFFGAGLAIAYEHTLKRTCFGSMVGEKVTWELSSSYSGDITKENCTLTLRNLKNNSSDVNPDKLSIQKDDNGKTYIRYEFEDDGIYEVALIIDTGTSQTLLQIIAPKTDTSSIESEIENSCKEGEIYDVIVVDGTSAGIGAAFTAAKEELKTCLLESTDLLGGMFTNGIGKTDMGLNKFGDLDLRLSYGVMDKLRKKVLYIQLKEEELVTEEDIEGLNDKAFEKLLTTKYETLSDDKKDYFRNGLKYRPSIVRKALYELLKEVDTNNLHIQLNTPFETVKKNGEIFEINNTYFSRYIIDATDSGDVAAILNGHNYDISKPNTQAYSFVMTVKDYNYGEKTDSNCDDASMCIACIMCKRSPSLCKEDTIDKCDKEYKECTEPKGVENKLKQCRERNVINGKEENWSFMEHKPSSCGDEGGQNGETFYTDESIRTSWTFKKGSGQLSPNVFQVKHHKSSDTLNGYWKLGYELIDNNEIRTDVSINYAEKDNDTQRYEIRERYFNHALCFLYHMQHIPNDNSIGLTRNEDPKRGNFPARLYVREGRRIKGIQTFYGGEDACKNKEQLPNPLPDYLSEYTVCAEGIYGRPLQLQQPEKMNQSIGVINYSMDRHSISQKKDCTVEGKKYNGAREECGRWDYLVKYTGPGAIPLGIMMPVNKNGAPIDKVLVPLAVSSTERGYSTLRMDPARINMGQAAALAISTVNNYNKDKQPEEMVSLPELLDNEKELFNLQKKLISAKEDGGYGGKIFLYQDIDNINAEQRKAIQFLSIWGIVKGYEGTYNFGPGDLLNRAQFCKMAVKLAEKADIQFNREVRKLEFSDVKDSTQWYYNDIYKLANKAPAYNLREDKKTVPPIDGHPDGTFKPRDNINRAEMLKIIVQTFFQDELIFEDEYEECKGKKWYCEFVLKALNKNIKPLENGNETISITMDMVSDMDEKVKRAEAAKAIFDAYIAYKGYDL
ncbi:MAG: FAD-dependent oxidoreductase [Desulfobacterales bacterium]|nr:FAD-dependent oxidoreductase [Desulfobacterales bacterium]